MLEWPDILSELWRTALLYVLAFVVFRLMGKRSVSHLAPFDIAVVIIIGEAVAIGIEEVSKPIWNSIAAIITLGALQFGLTWLNTKWRTGEKVSQGIATVLIRGGKMQMKAMAKEHMSKADLTIALREQGYEKFEDVRVARLEPTGHLSVLPVAQMKPVTMGDLGLPAGETLKSYIDRRLREARGGTT
ncbi:MAG: DUF421 domain-containing protein [Thermaerobacter sp.]|nr:DUF421 domain-containing protein [Thermaerobacter sp.]